MKLSRFCACAAALATTLGALAAGFHDHLGLQLWSLHATTKESTTKALDVAANFGFTEVETAGTGSLSAADFVKELQARKLNAIAAHASYEALTKNVAKVIADAKTLGAKYLLCPWIPHAKGGFTIEGAHRAAADFNAWGAACKTAGLQFGWHPHGFEFAPEANGDTPFAVIARETNPDLVVFEMDIFWVVLPGQDPVQLLRKYPGRWRLMHLKDLRNGAVIGVHTGDAPPADKVAVGDGQIDWPAVLAAAEKAGVKHYFIEDESVQPLKDIPASLRYLKALKP